MLGVDTEVRAARPASAGWGGTEHLDAFADVVADFAARPAATVPGLLAFLDVAADVENGLAPAEVTVAQDRVQILTVHAAKGLEWQVVAVPHLSGRVFPSTASTRTWLTDAADLPPLLRGDRATVVRTRGAGARHLRRQRSESGCRTRSLSTSAASSSDASMRNAGCCTWRSPGRRTRCCCPVTTGAPPRPSRAARRSSSASSRTSSTSRPPRAIRAASSSSGRPRLPTVSRIRCGTRWSRRSGPPTRPAHAAATSSAGRRAGGAGDVGGAGRRDRPTWTGGRPTSTPCWPNGTGVAERPAVALPAQLSVSTLVELGRDPDAVAQRLRRRLPTRPDPHALLGTAFHDWVQRFYGAERLFDLDDLPGAVDGDSARRRRGTRRTAGRVRGVAVGRPHPDRRGGAVRHGDRRHAWCADASTPCSPTTTAAPRWSTGRPVNRRIRRKPSGRPPFSSRCTGWRGRRCRAVRSSSVRAAFHYVRAGQTVAPDTLPGADELAALLDAPAA